MPPPDSHVHTEWSWDAPSGSMVDTCARAVELGLPSLAFTDHADFHGWVTATGPLTPSELNVEDYLACVERCRDRFPGLRILTGVELSEPHWHPDEVRSLLRNNDFERVLGSVHSARTPEGTVMIDHLYPTVPAGDVIRRYLEEVLRMVESPAPFEVLAHIDYPVRYWPPDAGPYVAAEFEEEFRAVLRALARSGRALEVNTRVPLDPVVVRWWYEAGGSAVSFGSDAHRPDALAAGFAAAAAVAEAAGFRGDPGDPCALWT